MESIRFYLRFVSNLMGQGAYGGDALIMGFINIGIGETNKTYICQMGTNSNGYVWHERGNATVWIQGNSNPSSNGYYGTMWGMSTEVNDIIHVEWERFQPSLHTFNLPNNYGVLSYYMGNGAGTVGVGLMAKTDLQIPYYKSDSAITNDSLALSEAYAFLNGIITYPIHYFHSDGCTITGPADAAPGQDCVVIVNPASGYVFRGSSGVVIQDSTGANVPFIVSGNRISFTYPQPI